MIVELNDNKRIVTPILLSDRINAIVHLYITKKMTVDQTKFLSIFIGLVS